MIPNKIKTFAWRAACDNLPTKKNKFRRTLETDSTCSICGTAEEDSFHAIVECTKARAEKALGLASGKSLPFYRTRLVTCAS
jgi:hypothetical protein